MELTAYVATAAKSLLIPQKFAIANLQSNQVLIAVSHCGVCRSDAHFIDNDWGDSHFPLVPGHEVVGHIVAMGEAVSGFKTGERVGVSWQQGACLQCEWCLQGKEEFCHQLQGVCLNCKGGFADQVVVDYRFIYSLPETIASIYVAPLLCAGITVYHALTVFKVQPLMRVGIIGMGGLGHLAIQFAKAMGCKVSVFSSSADKFMEAKQLGADDFIHVENPHVLEAYQEQLDFVLSTIYTNISYQGYLEALRPEGKLCFVGIPNKPVAISIFSLIIGQKSICASPMGNRNSMKAMLEFAAKQQIRPLVEVMPMKAVNEALAKVRAGQARYRIVLSNEIN
ncbi:MAG: hypothetical protein A3E87_08230 [Gammaproteobacteria bacterium RIFCSPHIGHO2_12_FULL_35_23]|nr:MAG: hypothetical protein A3E87_08230 [Gammaproteobacteria bacterium RIFCSPHIGHO2_12_FULL_35_23]